MFAFCTVAAGLVRVVADVGAAAPKAAVGRPDGLTVVAADVAAGAGFVGATGAVVLGGPALKAAVGKPDGLTAVAADDVAAGAGLAGADDVVVAGVAEALASTALALGTKTWACA